MKTTSAPYWPKLATVISRLAYRRSAKGLKALASRGAKPIGQPSATAGCCGAFLGSPSHQVNKPNRSNSLTQALTSGNQHTLQALCWLHGL